jgi:AcrR family transcriptional regulator
MANGISKGITKRAIVNVTLELVKDKEYIRSVNLREIARALGCAHTNLYNHFSDLDGILWDAIEEVLVRSCDFVLVGMDDINDSGAKLEQFYTRIIDFYLENRGWFRLLWMEELKGQRSDNNIALTTVTVNKYVEVLVGTFQMLYKTNFSKQETMDVFHTVHSYLHGEIAIFISGRGLITDEKAFKEYVQKKCILLSRLLCSSGR